MIMAGHIDVLLVKAYHASLFEASVEPQKKEQLVRRNIVPPSNSTDFRRIIGIAGDVHMSSVGLKMYA